MLVSNIGVALYDTVKNLPSSFEDIIPRIELVRCFSFRKYSALGSSTPAMNFSVILPHAKIECWNNENLAIASWVENDSFFPSLQISITKKERQNSLATSHYINQKLIEKACDVNCAAAIITRAQNDNSDGIEYAARHFAAYYERSDGTVEERPVICLCSMKLQESDPETLAKQLHQMAKELSLSEQSYYVLIYCCWSQQDVNKLSLPRGTVVIGIETLQVIFRPFGASYLLELPEIKRRTRVEEDDTNTL